MEFWGAEVKPGKPLKVTPDEDNLIHISQAALGETKKIQKGESVHLFAKVGEQKFVLGTLSHENFPQINFDLVFEKGFELSHNWKNGSIHVIGYKSPNIDEEDEGFSDASDEEELPVTAAENGKAKAVETAKPAKEAAVKPKAQVAEPAKNAESDSEDDSDDDEDAEDDESDSEEGMDVDEDSDEDSEDEDEETPKKVEQSKKRANESASKTPISAKKAKVATPPKTDGKKGGHTATPYPKKGGKTSPFASQSPKSGGQFSHGKNKNKNRVGK